MLINRLVPRRTAPSSSRGGFTLVELLVVIGIIAILAGVALGPITNGIKKAQQSGGMQTARTLALSEFQYSNDNNQVYPSGADAGKIASALISGGYISDTGMFYISGSPNETKYTGNATTAQTSFPVANCSWDFGEINATTGMNANAPDQTPLVMSSGVGDTVGPALTAPGIITGTATATMPFGTGGFAICYKSNSAKFIVQSPVAGATAQIEDASWPGFTMIFAQGNK